MAKVAIITDSNSGITQNEAKELGIETLTPFELERMKAEMERKGERERKSRSE